MPDERLIAETELIFGVLNPGESLVAISEFSQGMTQVTAAVTNTNFRLFHLKSNWLGRSLRIVSDTVIPLGNVSAITAGERDGTVTMTVFWGGHQEHFTTFYFANEARVFISEFRKMFAQYDQHSSGVAIADELEKLAQLTKDGVLTEADFNRAKDLFLGKAPEKQDQAIGLLRNLHGLYQSGVLSQSEFNMKKWDVLSKREFGA